MFTYYELLNYCFEDVWFLCDQCRYAEESDWGIPYCNGKCGVCCPSMIYEMIISWYDSTTNNYQKPFSEFKEWLKDWSNIIPWSEYEHMPF